MLTKMHIHCVEERRTVVTSAGKKKRCIRRTSWRTARAIHKKRGTSRNERASHCGCITALAGFGNKAHLFFFFSSQPTQTDGTRRIETRVSFNRFVPSFPASSRHSLRRTRTRHDAWMTPSPRCSRGVMRGFDRGSWRRQRRRRRNHVEWTARSVRARSAAERYVSVRDEVARTDGKTSRRRRKKGEPERRLRRPVRLEGRKSRGGKRRRLVWLTHRISRSQS